jgi:hypothetical protein
VTLARIYRESASGVSNQPDGTPLCCDCDDERLDEERPGARTAAAAPKTATFAILTCAAAKNIANSCIQRRYMRPGRRSRFILQKNRTQTWVILSVSFAWFVAASIIAGPAGSGFAMIALLRHSGAAIQRWTKKCGFTQILPPRGISRSDPADGGLLRLKDFLQRWRRHRMINADRCTDHNFGKHCHQRPRA